MRVLRVLLGPLVLLRYQHFNAVLDGVTFGASTGASFSGAQAITYSAHLIGAGLRPGGAVLPWVWRLLSLGLGMPIVTMGAAAAACAALSLRYRAPVRDAQALGTLGHPIVTLPLAGLLVMGAAVGETFLSAGGWLAWLVISTSWRSRCCVGPSISACWRSRRLLGPEVRRSAPCRRRRREHPR